MLGSVETGSYTKLYTQHVQNLIFLRGTYIFDFYILISIHHHTLGLLEKNYAINLTNNELT